MTATLPERATVARPDYDIPATEPGDGKRVTVRAWRHECAEWLRAHGIAASGAAWELVTFGERDLTVLRRAAADTGDPGALARHWSGYVLPGALATGDTLEGYGCVAGGPVIDPDTGAVWIVATRTRVGVTDHDTRAADTTSVDVQLNPSAPVRVTRGKGNLS